MLALILEGVWGGELECWEAGELVVEGEGMDRLSFVTVVGDADGIGALVGLQEYWEAILVFS